MASIKHNIRSPIIHQKDFKSLKIDQQILQQYTSLSTRHKDSIVNDSNDNSLGSTTESKHDKHKIQQFGKLLMDFTKQNQSMLNRSV